MSQSPQHNPPIKVPFHSLGISQIISYGLLFYVFAQLKFPLAEALMLPTSDVLMAVSGALILHALVSPKVGGWVDRYGALFVLSRGLTIGAVGMALLPLITSLAGLWFAMIFIGFGYAMATYETAFAAAVQLDEKKSRRHISFIAFYGGVASSITWLSVAPLLSHGLTLTCFVISGVLLLTALRFYYLDWRINAAIPKQAQQYMARFNWSILDGNEKRAIIAIAFSSTLEYLVFASTTLFWINWFDAQFSDPALAVMLAATYGPFQVVGRVLEMRFGHRYDARITGSLAFLCVPIALLMAQLPSIPMAFIAMAIFGIGHGILTVTFGFVTNMYFRAEVYGRAKGWIVLPKGFGTAFGPSIGGFLFFSGADMFFGTMIVISLLSGLAFVALLAVKPGNDQVI